MNRSSPFTLGILQDYLRKPANAIAGFEKEARKSKARAILTQPDPPAFCDDCAITSQISAMEIVRIIFIIVFYLDIYARNRCPDMTWHFFGLEVKLIFEQ